jgi:hypothetical protein
MPETTPIPKATEKILIQNLYISLYFSSRVLSHKASIIASQLASPMVRAGKIIWKEMVKANCILESKTGSKFILNGSMLLPILLAVSRLLISG